MLDVRFSELRIPSSAFDGKIPVAFTQFFDTLLGLSGNSGEGNGPLSSSCEGGLVAPTCLAEIGEGGSAAKADHKNTENNPVFRGMSQAKSRDLNQRKYCD